MSNAQPIPHGDRADSAGFVALSSALRETTTAQQAELDRLQSQVAFKEKLLADLRATLLSTTNTSVIDPKHAHPNAVSSIAAPRLVTVHPPPANPAIGPLLEYQHAVGASGRRMEAANASRFLSIDVDPVLVWSCPSSGSFTVALALTLSESCPGPIRRLSLLVHQAQDTPRHFHLTAKSVVIPLLKRGQSTTLCAHGTLHGLLHLQTGPNRSSLCIAISIEHDTPDDNPLDYHRRTTHRLPHPLHIPSPLSYHHSQPPNAADLGLAIEFPLCAALRVTYPGSESTALTILHWLDPHRSLSTLAHAKFANLSPGGLVALSMSVGVSVRIELSGKHRGQLQADGYAFTQLTQQQTPPRRTRVSGDGLVWTCEVSSRDAQSLAHFFSSRRNRSSGHDDPDKLDEVDVDVVSVGPTAGGARQRVGELADLVGEWVRKQSGGGAADWEQVDRMYELMQLATQ